MDELVLPASKSKWVITVTKPSSDKSPPKDVITDLEQETCIHQIHHWLKIAGYCVLKRLAEVEQEWDRPQDLSKHEAKSADDLLFI